MKKSIATAVLTSIFLLLSLPASGMEGGALEEISEPPPPTDLSGVDIVLKNCAGAYTKDLNIDLLALARERLIGAGASIKNEMEVAVLRFETFIHYFPGDVSKAEGIRGLLGVGELTPDRTLKSGLIKVLLGADAAYPLTSNEERKSRIYILDATGVPGSTDFLVDRLTSNYMSSSLIRDVVNEGLVDETTIFFPEEKGEVAGFFIEILGRGKKEVINGLMDVFVVIGPDFVDGVRVKTSDWEPIDGETYEIVIYKTRYIMEVIDSSGEVVARFPISIGSNPDLKTKEKVGDSRTPEGDFSVSDIHDSSGWRYEEELAYGPWFIRLLTPPWTGIGIHGTNEPYLIGAPISHGCIRMQNDDIKRLKRAVEIGTRVRILQ